MMYSHFFILAKTSLMTIILPLSLLLLLVGPFFLIRYFIRYNAKMQNKYARPDTQPKEDEALRRMKIDDL